MATYTTITGDTFELIARKQYGTEQEAGNIKNANPGLVEPFAAGITVTIPLIPGAPKNKPQDAPSNNINEVAVLIDGKRFRFWNALQISYGIDTVSTVEFGAPFEPDAPGFRETFQQLSYKSLEVTVGGDPLFTGTMIGAKPLLKNKQIIMTVSGYSLPGVLNDCTVPASVPEAEFFEQGLQEIATTMAGYFGISVVFSADPGPVFELVRCAPTKKVLSFLSSLMRQRNLISRSTVSGELEFLKSVAVGKPVAKLRQGASPVLSVTPTFNEQEYYSHITGTEPIIPGLSGSQHTVKNPFLTGVVRPFTFEAPDTIGSNLKEAVDAKLARMFGNIVSYAVKVDTWRDPVGELWQPNTTIQLTAPGAMIYNPYEFIIRHVSLSKESSSESAVLTLTLPGAFSGEIPETLPWLG